MAVEVAIGAFADAERPVDVEGDIAVMLNLFQHPVLRRAAVSTMDPETSSG
jgi:hypothetical protein